MKNVLLKVHSFLLTPRSFAVALYFGMSLFVFSLWLLKAWTFNANYKCLLEAHFELTAHKPFAFRLLIPSIAVLISSLVPQGVEDALIRNVSALHHIAIRFNIKSPSAVLPFWISLLLAWLSLFGWCFALRSLFRSLYRNAPEFAHWTPLIGLVFLPVLFREGTPYIYDFPAMLGSTLLYLTLSKRQWRSYAIVFAVFSFNKETTLLFVVPWFFYCLSFLKAKQLIQGLVLQIGIWLSIRVILSWLFKDNPGEGLENHFLENLGLIWNSRLLFTYESLVALGVIIFFLLAHWSAKPLLLRRGLSLLFVLLPLYLLGGVWGEIRVFYEVFPILLLLSADSLLRIGGHTLQTLPLEKMNEHFLMLGFQILRGLLTLILVLSPLLTLVTVLKAYDAPIGQTSVQALSQRKEPGTPWNAAGNIILEQTGLELPLLSTCSPRRLEVSVDNNDAYEFEFLSKERKLISKIVSEPSKSPAAPSGPGLEVRMLELQALTGVSIVRVLPGKGDGFFSLGHLLLEDITGRPCS